MLSDTHFDSKEKEEEIVEEVRQEQPLEIATTEQQSVAPMALNYLDNSIMNKAYKTASVIATSDLVPDTYKGKPANVLMAMDVASRGGYSLFLVMQNLYIVKGKQGWSGQFCIAAINACGKFSPLKFVDVTEGGGGCYAMATRLADGEVCCSPAVTMEMAKAEGWLDKNGSKWKTMPELMARYRAASFFARHFCPDVLFGMYTADELKDVHGNDEPANEKVIVRI